MICPACNLNNEFYKKSRICKECSKLHAKEYRLKNKESISLNKKRYYREKREDILSYKKDHYINNTERYSQKSAKYYKNNKSQINEYNREYRKNRLKKDPIYKTISLLRCRLNTFLARKKQNKKCKFVEYIGCSKNELRIHFESLFQPGMTWENQGLWHIDHIQCLSSAKSEEELYKLCHFSNLQPLWAIDNLKKGIK